MIRADRDCIHAAVPKKNRPKRRKRTNPNDDEVRVLVVLDFHVFSALSLGILQWLPEREGGADDADRPPSPNGNSHNDTPPSTHATLSFLIWLLTTPVSQKASWSRQA